MTATHNNHAPRFIAADEAQVDYFPWCRCDWLSRPGLTEAENMMVVKATMDPGEGHNFHRHPHFEEIIIVLEGEAEQWVDREKRILKAGDTAHIPTNTTHATFNSANKTLVFLAIISPCHFDGPPSIDMFDEEPWKTLRPFKTYPDYVLAKD